MTQEEKQLLLIDICARLPYGVRVKMTDEDVLLGDSEEGIINGKKTMSDDKFTIKCDKYSWLISCNDFKPYLRPMSSMTDEEMKTYRTLQDTACSYHYEFGDIVDDVLYFDNDVSLDYLNSIHIDYRGLIPMGLALEATKDMYKTE